MIINHLDDQSATAGEAADQDLDQVLQDYDSNGDGKVSALDALQVINYISRTDNTVASQSTKVSVDHAVNAAAALDDDLIRMLADDQFILEL